MTTRSAGSNRAGMSFIEISLATIILAVALLPVFGLIQGGLVRSDVSVSYSAATELASALMNKLLGDALPFDTIPDTPAGLYLDPAGSVAAEASLNPLFDEVDWQVEGKARSRTKDNIRYTVELWVGNFVLDQQLKFSYLENPNVDYAQATPFNKYNPVKALAADDWAFSPYNPAQTKLKRPPDPPGGHLDANHPGSAWATTVATGPSGPGFNQWEVIGTRQPNTPHDANQNLKKLVLRVSWSGRATGRTGLGNATKEFWLISLRANLGGN